MLTGTQVTLEDVNSEYKAFVDKFKQKKQRTIVTLQTTYTKQLKIGLSQSIISKAERSYARSFLAGTMRGIDTRTAAS